ncbi:unnamed protein product [Calypogeia fissa]
MALSVASSSLPCLKSKLGPSSLVSIAQKTSYRASVCLLHSQSAPNGLRKSGNSSSAAPSVYVEDVTSSSRWAHRWMAQNSVSRVQKKGMNVHAALATETSDEPKIQAGQWTWKFEGNAIGVYYKEYVQSGMNPKQTILMLPTLSDVSTTDEWQEVAEGLLAVDRPYKIVVVDWPGLGLSDRPPIDYTADLLETFLAEFMCSADGPLGSSSGGPPVIIGAGHAATIAARALSKGLIQARALVAVAPTWAGPLPIVFGRDSTMEFRYGLLRNMLRSPGVGWAMYKYLVSSPKNIRLQYLTHVYADAENVTPAMVENRTALTQRDGARFAPAAFLTGLLDPTSSREELLSVFAKLDGKVPTLVVSTMKSPRRSRAEMEALEGAQGVTKFVKLPGALLPQEEYPDSVSEEILAFLQH